MTIRLGVAMMLVGTLALGGAPPAAAQQTLNLTLGAFSPRGEDARVTHDVLVENLTFLSFDLADFTGPTVGAEWLVPLGGFLEAGAGIGFSRRTVPTVYTRFKDNGGREIEQDLRLRVVPVALTLRVLPRGSSATVQPYFGAGLGILRWRYSESGDFINFGVPGRPVFRGSFVADGSTTGPVALGGIRVASDSFSAGGEIRYQDASAALDDRFAGSRIDLGGWSYLFTMGIRFGR